LSQKAIAELYRSYSGLFASVITSQKTNEPLTLLEVKEFKEGFENLLEPSWEKS
jgi:hypothetical protein